MPEDLSSSVHVIVVTVGHDSRMDHIREKLAELVAKPYRQEKAATPGG
jgi:hypothetical protein